MDVIITTALIPGRKAPILVTQDMLDAMKPGSVIVDLAAANGGNVDASVPDEVITTDNGVIIVGFTDLPSRLPETSSALFSNNVANLILSIGPTTTKQKGYFYPDLADDVTNNMMIVSNGIDRRSTIQPYAPPPPPAPPAPPPTSAELVEVADEKSYEEFRDTAVYGSVAGEEEGGGIGERATGEKALAKLLVNQKRRPSSNVAPLFARLPPCSYCTCTNPFAAAAILATVSASSPPPATVALLSSFALAGLAGQQVVWGVAPALHSPLMAVTNAISGMTAVGGMLLLAHSHPSSSSLIPSDPASVLGAAATMLSFVNIAGGFLVSSKMLDLFRRPDDPKDFFALYAAPISILLATLGVSSFTDLGDLSGAVGVTGIASAILCISAIAGLSSQKSARVGNVLGIAGVGLGLSSTLGDMGLAGAALPQFVQLAVFGGAGAAVGGLVASKVGPTELPQTVAAFHSLVGFAAVFGALGEYVRERSERTHQ